MKKVSKSGERLWRDMRVRVVIPGQKDVVERVHCQARHGWTEAQLDGMLDKVAANLEQRFPSIEFRLVELAPNSFNFIYAGRKDTMPDSNLNACPQNARSAEIASLVCAISGHKLSTYQNGTQMTPQGPQMSVINFCSACGMSLSEVRGEIDQRVNAAVEQGIRTRLAAVAESMKPAKPPAGEPGVNVVDIAPREKATAAEAT